MITFGEVFNLQMGKTPARNMPTFWGGDHKWMSISDICGKYTPSQTKEMITDTALLQTGIKVVPKGTVMMSFKLSIGKATIAAEDIYTNEAIMAFINKGEYEIDNEWLYYYLSGQDWSEGLNKAVKGKTLNKSTLGQRKIVIPPIDKQRDVVKRLNAVVDTIEVCNDILTKFDVSIKARFFEMFGNEKNSKAYPVIKISDVADVKVGVVIKPAQYYTDVEHGVRAFRGVNIGEMTVKDDDWVYFNDEGQKKNAKSVLKENDIVIVRSGAPGTACVVTKEFEGSNAVDVIIAHPDTKKVNPYYLCAYTNFPHGKRQIEDGIGGAAQQHFNVGRYKEMDLIYPPKDEQDEFVNFVKQIDKSKAVVQDILHKLTTLQASLMQEYFG